MTIYNTLPHQNLFNSSKYVKLYFSIVEKALLEKRKKFHKAHPSYVYYESHHILPQAIYPEFKCFKENDWNKVLLTAKEHFIVHMLLSKCFDYTNNMKMKYPIRRMSKNNEYNARIYSLLKLNFKHSEEVLSKMRGQKRTEETKRNISSALKGKTFTEEHKNNIAIAKRNTSEDTRKKMSISGKTKIFTEEHRKNLSIATKGLSRDEKFKEKISKRFLGVPKSPEQREKISLASKMLPKKVCPHCGKEASPSNAKRWHFDNCKEI